jgi:hypothetical protein
LPVIVSLRAPTHSVGLLRTLIPFEQLGREPSGSILRDPHFQFAGARETMMIVARRP